MSTQSEYLYPGTNVLRNLPGIHDPVQLDRHERYHVNCRTLELKFSPGRGNFDLDHLRAIHLHLFQDLYPFAGELRNVNIGKNDFWFCDRRMITRLSDQIFTELKKESNLTGLSEAAFAKRVAYFHTEINYMHPFREGNGRSTREFLSQLARNSGYKLEWDKVSVQEYMSAVIKTQEPEDRADLEKIFIKCLQPLKVSR